MIGGIVMAVILLIFPVLVAIGGLIASGLLGGLLNADVDSKFEGSELLDLNT